MSKLVLELQADAVNPNVKVSDLLRKALMVARKLGKEEIEQWLNSELNGYRSAKDLPDYRKLKGRLQCYNPMRGWVPLEVADVDFAKKLATRNAMTPVGELESLGSGESDTVILRFSEELQARLMGGMEIPMEPATVFAQSQVAGILHRVRNAVLDWALNLEAEGVLGEGMTFSAHERAKAEHVYIQLENNSGTIVAGMRESQLQVGTKRSSQVFDKSTAFTQIRKVADLVRDALVTEDIDPANRKQLEVDVACIENELGAATPRMAILDECILSVRSIAEGLVASAAFAAIIDATSAWS